MVDAPTTGTRVACTANAATPVLRAQQPIERAWLKPVAAFTHARRAFGRQPTVHARFPPAARPADRVRSGSGRQIDRLAA
jgi:hypothetical protein